MPKQLIELRVNNRNYEIAVEPSQLLLDCLRQDLGLTGSKRGCDDSSCGACTVQIDGVPMLACTMLAASVAAPAEDKDDGNEGSNGEGHGPAITTVEGIAEHGA